MNEDLKFGLVVILFIVVITLTLFGLAAIYHVTFDRLACNQLATFNSGDQIKWQFWTGCVVYAQEEGMWLKYDDYMNFLSVRGEIDN
ncbi:MAG: hypothetical protein ACXACR_14690 [Candidatus Hodarchaeales archaeon]|jgi:hypothetical protein